MVNTLLIEKQKRQLEKNKHCNAMQQNNQVIFSTAHQGAYNIEYIVCQYVLFLRVTSRNENQIQLTLYEKYSKINVNMDSKKCILKYNYQEFTKNIIVDCGGFFSCIHINKFRKMLKNCARYFPFNEIDAPNSTSYQEDLPYDSYSPENRLYTQLTNGSRTNLVVTLQ